MKEDSILILTAMSPVVLGIATRYLMAVIKKYLIPAIDSAPPRFQRPLVMLLGGLWAAAGYAMGFPVAPEMLALIGVSTGPVALGVHWAQKNRVKITVKK